MPFYEYECSNCRFYVEVMQKISDTPLKKCPSCGKSALKKLISAPVFRLKGSGWYETDFKSDQERKRNLVNDKDDSGSSDAKDAKPKASSDAKAEAKPADAKSETKSEAPKPAAKPVSGKAGKTAAKRAAVKTSKAEAKSKTGSRRGR